MLFVLEVCCVFFSVYHMWRGTVIHDKRFTVMVLVWCFCNKYFVVYYVLCDVFCRIFFHLFFACSNPFFVIFHFEIIWFLIVIFVLVVFLFLLPGSLLAVFLDMSGFVTVIPFWYVFTIFMPELFSFVTVFTASCASTLLLGFYVEGFLIFSRSSWFWFFIHLVKFLQKLVTNPLNI